MPTLTRLLPVLLLAAGTALADCPEPATITRLAADWAAMKPARGLDPGMSMADALCAQQMLVVELGKTQGRIVGYKAGLTNPAVQKRFGYDHPVRGVLFEKMLLADGAEVPARFGARPVFEADLIVEVKDEKINAATTPEAVLASVSAIIPFIELPDLVVAPEEKLTGPGITAINVGARLGVMGARIAPEPYHVDALAKMQVVMRDGADNNKEIGRGLGNSILEHPLHAVIWLARDLARDGQKLRAGDLVSLGSFTPLVPPKPGMAISVTYEGLRGTPMVRVRFK